MGKRGRKTWEGTSSLFPFTLFALTLHPVPLFPLLNHRNLARRGIEAAVCHRHVAFIQEL